MRENPGCPICGKRGKNHRCSDASLRAIDAANTRALREDDDDYSNIRMSELYRESLTVRLREGFALLRMSGGWA